MGRYGPGGLGGREPDGLLLGGALGSAARRRSGSSGSGKWLSVVGTRVVFFGYLELWNFLAYGGGDLISIFPGGWMDSVFRIFRLLSNLGCPLDLEFREAPGKRSSCRRPAVRALGTPFWSSTATGSS